MRMLLAEDYDDARKLLEFAFTSAGFECDTASDGQEAVNTFDEAVRAGRDYDVILLDAGMPKLTGYEVAEHVRTLDSSVPIVMLTGDTMPVVEPHAEHSGINLVAHKPITPTELIGQVKGLIAGTQKVRSNIAGDTGNS